MPMLAELVEVVIGVDTHKDTHTAAVLATSTGAVLARVTVAADLDGYTELLSLAEQHSGLRGWAMEGSGGYGAGLARYLSDIAVLADRPGLFGQVASDSTVWRLLAQLGPPEPGAAACGTRPLLFTVPAPRTERRPAARR